MSDLAFELIEQYSTTFDAAGVALINDVGPSRAFERWVIDSIQISSTSVSQSRFEIHDSVSRGRLLEGTYSGNLDTTNTVFRLVQGRKLYFRFTLGTVGTFATVNVTGTRFAPVR